MPGECRSILVTGASGYLGGLVTATLLAHTRARLILPLRGRHTRDSVLEKVTRELEAAELRLQPSDLDRVVGVPLPPTAALQELGPLLRRLRVEQIVHCAGCLDYFDTALLEAGNVELTRAFVALGEKLRIRRFVYLSTAFSSGYCDGLIREVLHRGERSDPTEYTRTKRAAEKIVAESGIPYLIIRPSVVVGDSRDGRYWGKQYGVYQLFGACERLLADVYQPVLHVVAPPMRLQLVHQDAFQAGFLAAFRDLGTGSILHLVSRYETLATVKATWIRMIDFLRPREAYLYQRLDDVPLGELDRRQRLLIEFTATNIEISAADWHFETRGLDRLRAGGLAFTDATNDTVEIGFRGAIARSSRLRAYPTKFSEERRGAPRVVEVPRRSAASGEISRA